MEVLASRVLLRPRDMAASLAFYRDVLGLAIAREFPGGTVFHAGGSFLELSGAGTGPAARDVVLWLQVRDLAAAARDLAAYVVREARREPWGLDEMWIVDPDGTGIVLVEIPPEHPLRRDNRSPAGPNAGARPATG